MNKEIITNILKKLSDKREVFTSEADFQFSFAWEIKNSIENSEVILEYPVILPDKSTIYIDIVVIINGKKYPIELKYKTKKLAEVSIYGTQIDLKNQAAQDLGRYAYLKDIERIESLKKNNEFSTGYAIMITNDEYYSDNKGNKSNCIDSNFRIHENKVITGNLSWNLPKNTNNNNKPHWTTKYAPIQIKGKYTMKWNVYSNYNKSDFNLLINEI